MNLETMELAMNDDKIAPLFRSSGEGKAHETRARAAIDASFQASSALYDWKNAMLSKINLASPREWFQWKRRPTRLVCPIVVAGRQIWIWVRVNSDYHGADDDLSALPFDVLAEDVDRKSTRRPRLRYVEKAERQLANAVEGARLLASDREASSGA
jgi:hypothetical protein